MDVLGAPNEAMLREYEDTNSKFMDLCSTHTAALERHVLEMDLTRRKRELDLGGSQILIPALSWLMPVHG